MLKAGRLSLAVLALLASAWAALAASVPLIPYTTEQADVVGAVNLWIAQELNPQLNGPAPPLVSPSFPSDFSANTNRWIAQSLNPKLASPAPPLPAGDLLNSVGTFNAWIAFYLNPILQTGGGGFLPNCSGNFVPSNYSKSSNDFIPADGFWTTVNNNIAAATVTTVSDTLPDGTTGNVSRAVFPASPVAGSNTYSVLQSTDAHSLALYPVTHAVWAKVISGTGSLFTSITPASTSIFFSNAIPNDGAWHKVVNNSSVQATGQLNLQIGINELDPAQQAGTTSITVELTGDYEVGTQFAPVISYVNVKTGGPLATSGTTPLAAQISSPCPAHVALRDPTKWVPFAGNPILSESNTEVWRSGGVSNPYVQSQFQSGGFYWAFMNCSSVTEGDWLSYCLMKSTDGLVWTEDTLNAPYLQTPGSVLMKPTVSTGGSGFTVSSSGTATWQGTTCGVTPAIAVTSNGSGVITSATPSPNNGVGTGACIAANLPNGSNTNWAYTGLGSGSGASYTFASVKGNGATGVPSWFQLHPAFLPFGCSDGTTAHTFCVLYSAVDTGNTQNIYLAWADTIDGVYTPIGCTSGSCSFAHPVTYSGATGGGSSNAGLVSVINIGGATGTNYIYAITGTDFFEGTAIVVWSTPALKTTTTSGNTITFKTFTSFTLDAGLDWYSPNGSSQFEDPFVYLNHCGFYELYYTITNNSAPGAPFTNGKAQIVSQAVSDDLTNGTWWQYPAVTIPTNSPVYNGTAQIGDQAGIELGGQFILTLNYDNGSTQSRAMAITAPQGTCP